MTLKLFLIIYFIVYFGIAFLAKSWLVSRKINKCPLVLPKDDSAYGLIGTYFKLTLGGLFVYVVFYSFINESVFLPILYLENKTLKYLGLGLLLASLFWTILAQNHLKDSWRIGIDHETKTELITTGLFSFSRNPIFLGMVASLWGLFLTTPNTFTLIFLLLGYVLIQIQIRLEEEFLTLQHGEDYILYKQKTKRLI